MKLNFYLTALAAALSCGLATADTLNYTITSGVGAGQTLYQLTLTNSGMTGGTLFDLFVSVPIDINDLNTASIGTPAGWGDLMGGLLFFGPDADPATSFIEWTAATSGAEDVPNGEMLSGFSFTTLEPVHGPIRFALNDSTTLDTAVQGSPVPEAATSRMLFFGALFFLIAGLWGRRKYPRATNGRQPLLATSCQPAWVMSKVAGTRILSATVLCLSAVCTVPIARGAQPIPIPMTADHWDAKENAEFLHELGFYRGLMRLNSGNAVLKGITFGSGTIEFDVNTIGRGAPGIVFRQGDQENFELLYFRPEPNCPAFQACMQYAPQTHGVLLWDLFPQYQTRAPLRENGWNHVKMVVSGRRMNVFVNDAPVPTLAVGRLEGDPMNGGLRLQGPATFANMVITPDAVDGLSPEPVRDPLEGDGALIRNWRLSPYSVLPDGKEPTYTEMPGAAPDWKSIRSERNGLLNLSREYGRPLPEPNRALAWLKTTITSDRKQAKKVELGWTREVWIFLNGKLIYSDKNLFEQEGARKFPDGRCSFENGAFTLPLEAGDNEVAVAIANNFFGWGVMLRLTDTEGVHPASK